MTKPSVKSNTQGRGGSRPGAGRKPKIGASEKAIGDALEAMDEALKINNGDGFYTPKQRRRLLAMTMWGIPPEIIGAALFRPGVADSFEATIENAIKTVEVCQGLRR
jgi:hypothetical protein